MPVFSYPGTHEERNIKVTYFDVAGRGESIRQTLYLGGVAFKDVRLNHAQWANLRPSTPYGQLPLLEVDGKVLAQSNAQLIWAGQLTGTYPTDAFHRAQVNELLFLGDDIGSKLLPSLREQDAEKKKTLRLQFVELLPQYIGYLDKAVTENGSGKFLVGDSLTIADLAITLLLHWLTGGSIDHVPADILDKFPKLKEYIASVDSTPKLAEYRAKSQENKKHAKPHIKLTYFDAPGRAESIRMAFLIGDIEFEDERLDYGQWAVRKPLTPFGQMPLLDVDGKILTQSLAILIYAGTLAGLYPTDPVKRAKVNEALFLTEDFFGKLVPSFFEKDEEKKKEMRAAFATGSKPLLTAVDALLGDQDYIAGELSVADLGTTQAFIFMFKSGILLYVPTDLLDEHPRIQKWITRVDQHPKVVDYKAVQWERMKAKPRQQF